MVGCLQAGLACALRSDAVRPPLQTPPVARHGDGAVQVGSQDRYLAALLSLQDFLMRMAV
jgi:hypothetical protein